jgi:5,5'-dehydrodivanillate O-demethylase oxygenase subunit
LTFTTECDIPVSREDSAVAIGVNPKVGFMSSAVHPRVRERRNAVDFTSAGPGTPGGKLLRLSWQPIYIAEKLKAGQLVPLHVMGERFTLYRGESGAAHLVGFRCAHRRTQLSVGWVRGDAVQCLYHGWTYDGDGACIARPGERPPGPCANVSIPSYPVREHLGLIFVYLGEGEPPELPFSGFTRPGIVDNMQFEMPCNWWQSYENVFDEAHAAFVHTRSGSHADLGRGAEVETEITETEYGFDRRTWVGEGPQRLCVYPFPNHMRLNIGRMKGLREDGPWLEAFLSHIPSDDENHTVYMAILFPVTGADAEAYMARRPEYLARLAAAEPVPVIARDILAGRRTLDDARDHPLLLQVEDAVAQGAQGPIYDRTEEILGRTDVGVSKLRRVFERELRAVAEGPPTRTWTYANQPDPTQGF